MIVWPVIKEIAFKANFNFKSGSHFDQLNGLSNFGRGHHEKHFCEIILNLDQWFSRRCHLKYNSYPELLMPFCSAE